MPPKWRDQSPYARPAARHSYTAPPAQGATHHSAFQLPFQANQGAKPHQQENKTTQHNPLCAANNMTFGIFLGFSVKQQLALVCLSQYVLSACSTITMPH